VPCWVCPFKNSARAASSLPGGSGRAVLGSDSGCGAGVRGRSCAGGAHGRCVQFLGLCVDGVDPGFGWRRQARFVPGVVLARRRDRAGEGRAQSCQGRGGVVPGRLQCWKCRAPTARATVAAHVPPGCQACTRRQRGPRGHRSALVAGCGTARLPAVRRAATGIRSRWRQSQDAGRIMSNRILLVTGKVGIIPVWAVKRSRASRLSLLILALELGRGGGA
jgi:hypothetical protein